MKPTENTNHKVRITVRSKGKIIGEVCYTNSGAPNVDLIAKYLRFFIAKNEAEKCEQK